jgi:branched-subunit amino acid aminotransferase/4-amino-4-deoxychorismate lyase
VLLELAERETIEGVFPLERLLDADEVFICASVREVMPVAEVDGKAFPLGLAARELQQALRRRATPS